MSTPSISVVNCGQRVQPRLDLRQSYSVAQYRASSCDRRELDALRPIGDELLAGPARRGDAPAQVVDLPPAGISTWNGRLEPTTFCMASRRSSQLSYIRGSRQSTGRGEASSRPLTGPGCAASWRRSPTPGGRPGRPRTSASSPAVTARATPSLASPSPSSAASPGRRATCRCPRSRPSWRARCTSTASSPWSSSPSATSGPAARGGAGCRASTSTNRAGRGQLGPRGRARCAAARRRRSWLDRAPPSTLDDPRAARSASGTAGSPSSPRMPLHPARRDRTTRSALCRSASSATPTT